MDKCSSGPLAGRFWLGNRILPAGLHGTSFLVAMRDLHTLICLVLMLQAPISALGRSEVLSWGSNIRGQLAVPAGLSNVVALAAGGVHSMALTREGNVFAWGNNENGQTNVPSNLGNVVAIACGGSHSLALKTDGTVTGWGDNAAGQLGFPRI